MVETERRSESRTCVRFLCLALILFVVVLSFFCSQPQMSGLMKWEEYRQMPNGIPYVYTLNLNKGGLIYYGAIHTISPDDPQISTIEEWWDKFQPDLALCEGCVWPLENTYREAVRKYGEQGLLRFLAERDGVPIKCIDPPKKFQARYLKVFFTTEEIKVYYVMLHTLVKRRMGKDLSDEGFVESIIQELSRCWHINDFPASLADFKWVVKKLFPEFSDWREIPYTYFFCSLKGKYLPEIHSRLRDYRNLYQVNLLIRELKKGKRVFAVVGRSHVVMQEPVIRKNFR